MEPTVTLTLTVKHVVLLRRLVKKRLEYLVNEYELDMDKELDMLDDIAVALAAAD